MQCNTIVVHFGANICIGRICTLITHALEKVRKLDRLSSLQATAQLEQGSRSVASLRRSSIQVFLKRLARGASRF